jgi:glycosyltransferase involved in cell wall biosynthesis
MGEFQTLSILIPAYNEENYIAKCVEKVIESPIDFSLKKELIIVDDASKDGTKAEMLALEKKYENVKCYFHEKNKGKGAAIRTALEKATGDIVIIQDADLEYNPEDYSKLVKPIINKETTVVYGSRWLGGQNKHASLKFYLGGRMLTVFTNILFPGSNITDEATCYKVFKKEVIDGITLVCDRFNFCPEVTAKLLKRKVKIIEVPIDYNSRDFDEGKKIGWIDGVSALYTLLKYRLVG